MYIYIPTFSTCLYLADDRVTLIYPRIPVGNHSKIHDIDHAVGEEFAQVIDDKIRAVWAQRLRVEFHQHLAIRASVANPTCGMHEARLRAVERLHPI